MARNVIRSLLQNEGYDVLVAADGDEALDLARAHTRTIDLFLTDVEMPHVDGISAYRQISTERPNLKVLFMSGAGTRSQLMLPAAWPYLVKPVEADTLRTKLTEILKVRPPTRAQNLKVILVVDHDAHRRERTKKILTENGYAVLTANSVREAEAVSDSITTIDLIVSGVVFDGDTGVHLAEHVEASERHISTLLISHFRRNLLNDVPGFSRQPEFLPNPFTAEALLMVVRRLLDRQK
jgi:DNA-binding NtrC family response regulator